VSQILIWYAREEIVYSSAPSVGKGGGEARTGLAGLTGVVGGIGGGRGAGDGREDRCNEDMLFVDL
jgi:hypothetical protein